MAITNPEAIRFVNQEVRPMAERLRDLNVLIDDITVAWFAGINANIPNDAGEAVEDGRESQGVSRLTGADINNFITQLSTIQTQFDGGGVMDVIVKPTVQPLTVG